MRNTIRLTKQSTQTSVMRHNKPVRTHIDSEKTVDTLTESDEKS